MDNFHSLQPDDLINQSIPFDKNKVALLDEIIRAFGSNNSSIINQANRVLTLFQEDSSSWQYVDIILENSTELNAKFIALGILDDTVKNRWKALPDDQKNGIKTYITDLVINMGKDDDANANQKTLLSKLNQTLVSIIKHEWTTTWRDFIPDICNAAQTHQGL